MVATFLVRSAINSLMDELVLIRPDEGEQLGQGILRVGRDEVTVLEYTLDAAAEAGEPHIHKRHVDAFFVLEGELEFPTGTGRSMRAPVGSLVLAAPGVVHAFPRAVTERARFLNIHAPGGFHRTLRELLEVRARGLEPSAELRERHDGFPLAWRSEEEPGT
jgi:quercetin dioxygenase-like cupin family protein